MKTPSHPIIPQLPTEGGDRVKFDKGMQEVVSNLHGTVRKDLERMTFTGGKRQTVLSGKLDKTVSPNVPDFLEISGSSVNIVASSSDPLTISFANGHDAIGAYDLVKQATSSVIPAWTGFTANRRYFLYAETSPNIKLAYGKTIVPPQYEYAYDKRKMCLFHFDGADGSTTFTDAYGNGTWTNGGSSAHIEVDQYKFGTSSICFDGVNDYLTSNATYSIDMHDRWSIDFWLYRTTGSVLQALVTGETNYTFALQVNASNKLLLYLSSNGSSWNIAAGTGAAVGINNVPTSSWCHIAMEWDGAEYRVYLDGAEEIAVASTSAALPDVAGVILGCAYDRASYDLTGYIDELRICTGMNMYGSSFTVPTSAYDGSEEDPHLYLIPEGKMSYGSPLTNTWTSATRVFFGEVETDGSGVPSSVTNYAFRGETITAEEVLTDVTVAAYVANHNIGRNIPIEVQVEVTNIVPETTFLYSPSQKFIAYAGRLADASANNTIKLYDLSVEFILNYYLFAPSINTSGGLADNIWSWRAIVRRLF